jgi:hypothetical protein
MRRHNLIIINHGSYTVMFRNLVELTEY